MPNLNQIWQTLSRLGFLSLAILMFQTSPTQAQQAPLENYFQIRFFYPFPLELPEFYAGLIVDANIKFDLEPVQLNFKITNTGALRQQISLEASANFGYASLEFSGAPGSEITSRQYGLVLVGQYFAAAPTNPLEIQYFGGAGLTYVFQTESSSSGFTLNALDFSIKGNLAKTWRWTAGYGLSSVQISGLPFQDPNQNVRADVKGTVENLELGLTGNLAIRPINTEFGLKLDASYKLSPQDTLAFNASWNSRPTDDERITFTTLRLEPSTLSFSVGRGSQSILNWGLGIEYPIDPKTNLSASYEGFLGDAPEHDFGLQVSYREKLWNARGSSALSVFYDPSKGLWFGRINLRVNGSYRVAPWMINLRGGIDIRADRFAANLGGSLNFTQDAWNATLELSFNYQQNLTGNANLQVLYALSNSISLNASANYSRTISPLNAEQFGFGLGMRFNF